LFSITTKYFTLLNLTTTTFLISWFSWSTAYQTQQTFPGITGLKPSMSSKELLSHNCSHNTPT
jgi:hypothetical protein